MKITSPYPNQWLLVGRNFLVTACITLSLYMIPITLSAQKSWSKDKVTSTMHDSTSIPKLNATKNLPPIITCPANVSVGNDRWECFATGVDLGLASASDDGTVVRISNNAPNKYYVGDYNVTWTATDNNGNSSTCIQVVTVKDDTPPVISCPGPYYFDASQGGSIGDAVAFDNCGVASITNDAPAIYPGGITVVTWTATDNSGNTSTCTQDITVLDDLPPVITCPPDANIGNDQGLCTASRGRIGTATATDNSTIASITNNAPAKLPLGRTIVTWTATDNFGNSSTCRQVVTVSDTEKPAITCPANINVNTAPGQNYATGINLGTPTTTDNCGIASVTNNALENFPAGITTVTWTVTDNAGNTASCTQNVTVTDNQPPVINCPADINSANDAGFCSASGIKLGKATATDSGPVTISNDAPASFPVGTTIVTWTASDNSGNTSTCTQNVTINDTENPTITCPALVNVPTTPGQNYATGVNLENPTTADNCGVASVTNNAPENFPEGTTEVTWTVTDNAGNTASCTQNVIVTDNQPPVINCPADITSANDPGLCSASGLKLGMATATDNGPITINNDAPASFPVGTTQVTWTARDNSGNTATCIQNVTVNDTENPTITCPATINVYTSPGLNYATGVNLGNPTTADNCGVASVTNNAPVNFPVGTTQVTWTVTDQIGNTNTCTQRVIVTDNQPPVINCPAGINTTNDAGLCSASGIALGSATATDNGSIASIINDAPASFPVGTTQVTWTATDNHGNKTTCTQNVSVLDNEKPTISCPANINVTTSPGLSYATGLNLGNPTTADNCGVASVTNNAPANFPVGTTQVTWTVTDNAGNTASCSQNVTVTDNQAPVVSCPADIITANDAGLCSASGIALGSATATDNGVVTSIINDAPASFSVGTTQVTWTATDNHGNASSCSQNVTVNDTEKPTISCPANINVSTSPGLKYATGLNLGNPTTADNCGVASVTNNAPANFPIGTTQVTWSVTDNAGNSATCTQNVTVTDNQAPVINCPADINVANDAGLCSASGIALGTATATDNDSVTSVYNDAPASFPVGVTSVTWTSTDNSGNTSNCVQVVTVIDSEGPTLSNCQGDSTIYEIVGQTGAVFSWPVPTAIDNCEGTVAVVRTDATGLNPGDVFPVGSSTIRYESSDKMGNTTSCSFTITIIEVNDPPSDISLVPQTIDENQPTGTIVGTLSTTDPDVTDSHSYELVNGLGADDNGSFSILGNQVTANESFNFETKNTYYIRIKTSDDGLGNLSFEKSLTIGINNINEIPEFITTPVLTVKEGSLYTYTINTFDEDGDIPNITAVILPKWLNLIDNGDGTALLSGTPSISDIGLHNVGLMVKDIALYSNQDFSIEVLASNIAPIAIDDNAIVNEDEVLIQNVAANDQNPGNEILQYSVVNGFHQHGVATISSNGTLNYRPVLNYFGMDTVSYRVCVSGSSSYCSTATVAITINPVNDPPIAADLVEVLITDRGLNNTCIRVEDIDSDVVTLTDIVGFQEYYSTGSWVNNALCFDFDAKIRSIKNDTLICVVCDNGTPKLCDTGRIVLSYEVDDLLNITQGLSPNNDGKNDTWIIHGISNFPNNQVQIFNRWGNLIYKTENYTNEGNSWDGTINTGISLSKKASPGTYFFILKLREVKETRTGYIIIN